MSAFFEVVKLVVANKEIILESVLMILSGVVALALLIPGDQPEKTLQKGVDFLKKFSRKPKAE